MSNLSDLGRPMSSWMQTVNQMNMNGFTFIIMSLARVCVYFSICKPTKELKLSYRTNSQRLFANQQKS